MGPLKTTGNLLAIVYLGALCACTEASKRPEPDTTTSGNRPATSKGEVRGEQPRAEVRGEQPRAEVRGEQPRAEVRGEQPRAEVRGEQPRAEVRGEQPRAEVRGERLRAEPPDGWQQGFATETPALRIVEFIPADASQDDWQEKVTFESLSGDPLPDPIDFVTGIAADQSATCEPFEHFNVQSGLENNYPTSVRLMSCGHNKMTEKGQVTLIKAIQANDHFYVITRAKRVPPPAEGSAPISEAEMAIWAAYMRAITVCDPDRDAHPCEIRSDPPADP